MAPSGWPGWPGGEGRPGAEVEWRKEEGGLRGAHSPFWLLVTALSHQWPYRFISDLSEKEFVGILCNHAKSARRRLRSLPIYM